MQQQLSPQQVWEAALGELQLQMARANYETWLRDTEAADFDGETFTVGAPSAFVAEWLERRLRSVVRKTLLGLLGRAVAVRFVVSAEAGTAAALTGSPPPPANARPNVRTFRDAGLNPRYTFGTFVVGVGNRMAHAAATSVVERPGDGYNPLFLYGGVGLGKTHLLHAIGHACLDQNLKVLYVTSEQFTNEFITGIRERKTEEFRQRYRKVDILLMDDIQFIAGKEQTQEGVFHTFNDLHNASRQIVLTSDRPPRHLALLEERLRSRFEWGLIADIEAPDLETRIAILSAKAEEHGEAVPLTVLELIAQRVTSNVRELEGCLNRVLAYSHLHRQPLTVELCRLALRDLADAGPSPEPAAVVESVARHFRLEAATLRGPRRQKELVLARHIAMYLLREDCHSSYPEIGRELGGRDHTTVIYGVERVGREREHDPAIDRILQEIRTSLTTPPR